MDLYIFKFDICKKKFVVKHTYLFMMASTSNAVVLKYHNLMYPDEIEITDADFGSLQPNIYLNDTIIDFYIR